MDMQQHYSNVASEGGNLAMYKCKTVLGRMNKNVLPNPQPSQKENRSQVLQPRTKKPTINGTAILATTWKKKSHYLQLKLEF